MKPQFSLRCLGQPALIAPNGEPLRIRTKKHLALLAYLAVESRRSHRRDDLAEFLWPRAKSAEARHSLSTALSIFRARLGKDTFDASQEKIALKPGRLALDLDRLVAGQALGDEFTPPLEVAGFLDGFDIADAPEFTLWKDRQQARLLPAIKQALVALIDRGRRSGEFSQIEAIADRMLALDDLSEEAIRAKMEARALAGDRIGALRVFEEWTTKLASELQAVPSEELHRIAAALRSRRWQQQSIIRSGIARREQDCGRPFVGRKAEYLCLYNTWRQARDGAPAHLLILGDSGVGKTTLVQRFADAVALEGTTVIRVQCYDVEHEIPYSTLSSLVDELTARPGASGTPPESLAQLSSIAPSIRRTFSVPPIVTESHGEASRIRITEAFMDLLRAVADDQNVLIVIDDLHFADDASLAALHLVIRRTRSDWINMLFISRPGDLPLSPQASLLRDNKSTVGIKEICIDPLDEADSETLLGYLIPATCRPPNASTRRALLRAASGYPMALELLVQDWLVSGTQCLALSIDAITEDMSAHGNATNTYKHIIQRITSTLHPCANKVLSLAAILGNRVSDLGMYSILDLSHSETIGAVTELVSRRLLRDNGHRLEFVNELIRSAAYLSIPSPVRKQLHSQVADRFLKAEKASGIHLGLEIAWHCTRAGRNAEAVDPLIRGARSAMRYGTPYLAEQALVTALPMLKGQPKTEAVLLLAEALQEQARWQDVLTALDELGTATDRRSSDSAYIFELTSRRRLGTYNGTEELRLFTKQLLDFLNSSPDTANRLRAAAEAAAALQFIRCETLASQILEAIAAIPPSHLDDNERPQLLLARAMVNFSTGNYASSIHDTKAALRIMEDQHIVNSTLAMLQSGLGSMQSLFGQYRESSKQLRLAASTATRIGNERIFHLAAANLSVAHNRLGEYDESVKWAEIALSYPYELHSAACQGILASQAMLGNTQLVTEIISRWTQPLRQHYPVGVWQAWELLCADAYLLLGKPVEAEHFARQATSPNYGGLLLHYCAGTYARWIARLGVRNRNTTDAMHTLCQLRTNLSRYHDMDQVEILVAMAWLEHQRGGDVAEQDQNNIQKRLDALPIGITDQLKRMEMLKWLQTPHHHSSASHDYHEP